MDVAVGSYAIASGSTSSEEATSCRGAKAIPTVHSRKKRSPRRRARMDLPMFVYVPDDVRVKDVCQDSSCRWTERDEGMDNVR
jgi:hypothetical protein